MSKITWYGEKILAATFLYKSINVHISGSALVIAVYFVFKIWDHGNIIWGEICYDSMVKLKKIKIGWWCLSDFALENKILIHIWGKWMYSFVFVSSFVVCIYVQYFVDIVRN